MLTHDKNHTIRSDFGFQVVTTIREVYGVSNGMKSTLASRSEKHDRCQVAPLCVVKLIKNAVNLFRVNGVEVCYNYASWFKRFERTVSQT